MTEVIQTARTRMRHCAHKACYDRAVIEQIIDAIPECTIAIVDAETGQPRQMVSSHWRVGEALYIHGSNGSQFCRQLAQGRPASVSIAATDGLVLARSAFDTSVLFRSVTAYGQFHVVRAEAEQRALLQAFYEHLLPGRWQEIRAPSAQELAATLVLCLPLTEMVAKISVGEPDDQAEAPAVWGGVWPYRHVWGRPQADAASQRLVLPPSIAALPDGG